MTAEEDSGTAPSRQDESEQTIPQARDALLSALSSELGGLTSVVETMERVGRMVGTSLNVQNCIFAEFTNDAEQAMVSYGWHAPGARSLFGIYPMRDFLSNEQRSLINSGELPIIAETQTIARVGAVRSEAVDTHSFIIVPLVRDEHWRFMLCVIDTKVRAWRDDEIALAREVAERVWLRLERARAEEALRKSESRFQSLFESMDEGYALCELLHDQDMRSVDALVLEANPAYSTLTGHQDPVGKTLTALSTNVSQAWIDVLASVTMTGIPRRFEQYNREVDRWFDVYVAEAPCAEANRIFLVLNDITERRRMIEALQESEARYRTLFDSIDQGFCTVEVLFDDAGEAIDYRFLELNPAFARNTGLENAVGERMRALAPSHEEHWFRIYGQVAQTLEPVRFEAEAAALGRWYNVYAYPVGNPKDHRVAVLFEDITDRRRANAALRESEVRFRTLIQNLPDYAIYLLDPNGVITEWSEGSERITGFTSEEAIGQHVALLYPAEAVAACLPEQELAEAAATGRVEYEGWLIRKNGERFWGNEIATAVHDHSGALIGYTRISRDLTEQRRAEGELLASEERLRAIVEAATDYAIFTVDAQSCIQDWFPGAAAVFGWSAEEAVGQPFAMTFTAEDRALGIPEQEFQQARQSGSAADARWREHKTGSRVFIESVVRARYDLDGEFLGVLKIGRDATERQLAEKQRIDLEEQIQLDLRSQVASGTAELRTLSRRLLMVQEEERRALARELHDEIGQALTGLAFTLSTAATTIGQIAEAQRIVSDLTEQVRQLSMDLRPAALDSYGLLPALRGHIEQYDRRTGNTVDLRVEGMDRRFAAAVEITAYRIVQEALTNLARHAQTSVAIVQFFADDDMLTVSIRDDGVGFDPAHVSEGSGLGGMRERAELLGGTLEIDAALGAGVRITAELPLSSGNPRSAIEGEPGETP